MYNVAEIRWISALYLACQLSCKISVVTRKGDIIEGEARHIVTDERGAFVHGDSNPSMDHMLRITGKGDYFIPLHEINAVNIQWDTAYAKPDGYLARPTST